MEYHLQWDEPLFFREGAFEALQKAELEVRWTIIKGLMSYEVTVSKVN